MPRFTSPHLCDACWIAREQAFSRRERLEGEVARLEREVARLERALLAREGGIPAEILRLLILLCHPDRHGGSDASNRATAWLLAHRDPVTR